MDNAALTVSLAMVAGVLAQALAVHVRMPGIILLLAVGVLLGPDAANVVRPALLGGGLQVFVGFAVAIILFEGGLQMNLKRLRRQAKPIRRLVTIGAVVTALGAAGIAYLAMGWDLRMSILFGTLVIVTGPTVVTPLLRKLRVQPHVATILEAEGIFIDAVGATIAVVALEAVLAGTTASAAVGIFDVAWRIGIGAVVGLAGGALLLLLFRWRQVVPDGLENILGLAVAVATFQVSNAFVHESGITAAIVAGMVLANTDSYAFDELVEFKEQLTSLFIATLFVLLSADVRIDDVLSVGTGGVVTVLLLMFLVRPLTVAISTWGTDLGRPEKLFLSWLAPRGIVAAAVASLFAIRLAEDNIDGGLQMRALVFLVIATTVTVQGLTGGLLATLLKLRRPKDVGYLIIGANPIARSLAAALRASQEPVLLVDSNEEACNLARQEGFDVLHGNGLEQETMMRAQLDTRRAAIALTSNESVNFIFARKVRDHFRGAPVYLALESESTGVTVDMVDRLPAQVLFGGERHLARWIDLLGHTGVTEEWWELGFPGEGSVDFAAAPPNAILPLLAFRDGRPMLVGRNLPSRRNDQLLVFVQQDLRTQAYDWLRGNGYVPVQAIQE